MKVEVLESVWVGDHYEYIVSARIGEGSASPQRSQRRITDVRKLHQVLERATHLPQLPAFPIQKLTHFLQTDAIAEQRRLKLQQYLQSVIAIVVAHGGLNAVPELRTFLSPASVVTTP